MKKYVFLLFAGLLSNYCLIFDVEKIRKFQAALLKFDEWSQLTDSEQIKMTFLKESLLEDAIKILKIKQMILQKKLKSF